MRKFLGLMLLCATLPAAAEVPLKDFARFDSFDDATISPDGAYIALRVPIGIQWGLAVVDSTTLKPVAKITLGADRGVYGYRWAGPKRLIAEVTEDFGFGEEPSTTGELFAVDVDGKDGDYLYGYRGAHEQLDTHIQKATQKFGSARFVRTLPDDPDHAVIATYDWNSNRDYRSETAYRIDVHNGKLDQNLAAPIPGSVYFVADRSGFIRYATGNDQHLIVRTFVRTPEAPAWRRLESADLVSSGIEAFGLSNDNTRVFLSSFEGSDRRCLVEQNLLTGVRTKLSCDAVSDLGGVIWSFDHDEPIAVIYQSGRPEVRLLDTKNPSRAILAAIEQAFPDQVAIPVSYTRDGRKVIVEVYSDRNPGDYYLFDTETMDARYLVGQNAWIDPDQMSERRPVHFAARDGSTLYGYLTLPLGHEPKNLPLVINPHGGPFFVRDHWIWESDAQAMASRGYAVMQVNYRGSAGFGENFRNVAKQGWDHVMIDDITDAAHWTVAQGYADPKRLCIVGASYGGYAAMMSAVREPDLYRCVVDYAGPVDLERQQRDTDSTLTLQGRNYYEDFVGADAKRLHDASPLTYIDRLKAALMIVHGKDDRRVPFSQAEMLRDALDKRHYPYEWLVKSGEGHGFYNPENRREYYEKLIAFLNKNIGPGAATKEAESGAQAMAASADKQ